MKIDELREIVQLMSENDLSELRYESEAYNLCLKRGGAPVMMAAPQMVAAPAVAAAPAVVAAATAEVAPAAANCVTIDSPIVGTFYRSPSPDAAPFVKIGDRVSSDSVVGIIEAMKVMNEIKAEKSGIIKDILIENGQAVEFGQPIFVIE